MKFPKHSGGLISIGTTKLKYKKNKKAKTTKYGSDIIDEIIFGDENYATVHYKYVSIGKKRSVLMELEIRGKVNLFSRIVSNITVANKYDPNFQEDDIIYYDQAQFYIKRDNEDIAKLIIGPNLFGDINIKSRAKKYFSNYSKIVEYIEKELYDLDKLSGLIELVDDYNLFCE